MLLENKEREKPVKEDKKFIILKSNGIEVKQYLEDIIFIEVLFKKIYIYTRAGSFEINNMSLDKMKELTADSNIIYDHSNNNNDSD